MGGAKLDSAAIEDATLDAAKEDAASEAATTPEAAAMDEDSSEEAVVGEDSTDAAVDSARDISEECAATDGPRNESTSEGACVAAFAGASITEGLAGSIPDGVTSDADDATDRAVLDTLERAAWSPCSLETLCVALLLLLLLAPGAITIERAECTDSKWTMRTLPTDSAVSDEEEEGLAKSNPEELGKVRADSTGPSFTFDSRTG
jgi:hypothetical protein